MAEAVLFHVHASSHFTREMLDHYGANLSEQYTAGFMFCYGTQTMHTARAATQAWAKLHTQIMFNA